MKMGRARILILAGLCLLTPSCAPRAGVESRPLLVQDVLYFGEQTPRGPVTRTQWAVFLSREVTPRFPDGLTAWDARGQWKDSRGVIGKEPTKVLLLIHPDSPAEDRKVGEIIEYYKKKFHQESVMRVRSRPEVSF